jgi:peroxiredoxin
MRTSWFLPVLVAAGVISTPRHVSQAPDSPAPAFTLKTLNGDSASLAQYQGRPVFLNFWASWCEPCRGEMRSIVAAYTGHQAQRLAVLAINLTDQEHMGDVRKFVDDLQLPFPVLLDEKGRVRRAYALHGVPTSVFIDPQGVVRLVNRGPISNETIQGGLARILRPSGTATAP